VRECTKPRERAHFVGDTDQRFDSVAGAGIVKGMNVAVRCDLGRTIKMKVKIVND
jgi:hypothetical protein